MMFKFATITNVKMEGSDTLTIFFKMRSGLELKKQVIKGVVQPGFEPKNHEQTKSFSIFKKFMDTANPEVSKKIDREMTKEIHCALGETKRRAQAPGYNH